MLQSNAFCSDDDEFHAWFRFLDPFFFGDYPEVMKTWLGKRLPKFTEEESSHVKGSLDFVGINHYSSMYAVDQPLGGTQFYGNYFTDPRIIPLCKIFIAHLFIVSSSSPLVHRRHNSTFLLLLISSEHFSHMHTALLKIGVGKSCAVKRDDVPIGAAVCFLTTANFL